MSLPKYYEFYNGVKINAGLQALETIPYELGLLGAKRPIIVTDKGVVAAGLIDVVKNSFTGSNLTIGAVYDQTPPDSSVQTVNDIVKIYRSNNCDSIIAVGGGSAIDTAKGVNILISEGDDDLKRFMGADRLTKPQQPLVVIPTTAGTGSEATLVAVISDTERGIKMPFASNLLMPKLAVLDPRMTMSLPPRITAATGMDALTHSIEAYTCLQKNPISDAFARAAIELVRDNIVTAVRDGKNVEARFAMANAATMAGIAFSNSMVGGVHAIGHATGAVAHVHHGNAMAILLPYVMKFNMQKLEDLYAQLLLPVAGEDVFVQTPKSQRARKTIETILLLNHQLNKICNMPVKLSEAGVRRDQLPQIAEKALYDGATVPNPKELTYDNVMEILNEAF